jgi:esterase/lipase
MSRSFAQYTKDCEQYVRSIRSLYYQGAKLEQVINMSLPFELKPAHEAPYKKGMLMAHGFLSSPYLMRSLAQDFAKANFLVRAVLLPGHGTQYQDLDNYTWEDWLATIKLGYDSLAKDCEEIYLCGFSIGATLSLLFALSAFKQQNCKIKKLILLGPCLGVKPIAKTFPFLVKKNLTRFLPKLFCTQAEAEHLGSYTQFSIKSVAQVTELLSLLKKELKPYQKQQIPLPLFISASHEDGTVKFKPISQLVKTHLQKQDYFYVYSNHPLKLPKNTPNTTINMHKGNILAMSHVAIPVAPTDPYFGKDGSYYGQLPENTKFGEPHLTHSIKRLTYNPDYNNLKEKILAWLI